MANSKLRVLPLGGLGEIGKNMTVVEYDGAIVVVDVGLRFPTAEQVGIDLVLPDSTYLRPRPARRPLPLAGPPPPRAARAPPGRPGGARRRPPPAPPGRGGAEGEGGG